MAIVQLRNDTEGRAHYRRKLAAGKTPMNAIRALERRLSDIVDRQLIRDQKRQRQHGERDRPGRTLGGCCQWPGGGPESAQGLVDTYL